MNKESKTHNFSDVQSRFCLVAISAAIAGTAWLGNTQTATAQDPFAVPSRTEQTPSKTAPAIPFTSPPARNTDDSVPADSAPAISGPPALSVDAFQGNGIQGNRIQQESTTNPGPDANQPEDNLNADMAASKVEATSELPQQSQNIDSSAVVDKSAQDLSPMEKAMEPYYDRPPFVTNPRPVARVSNDPGTTSALKPNTTPVTNLSAQPAGASQEFQPQGNYQRESSPPPTFGQRNANPTVSPVPEMNNFNNANEIPFENARAELIDDIEVPATSMGPISELKISDNDLVDKGQTIALIDDQEATRILQQAKIKYEMALARSQNTTSIEMAATKVKLATSEFETTKRLYSKGAKTKQEAERARYSKEIAEYELIEARKAISVARLEAQAELVNYHAARESLERHKIKSPISGIVYETLRDGGEWANRGDIVVRVASLDKLYVHTTLSTERYAPHAVQNKRVIVTTTLGGQPFQFSGAVARTGIEQEGVNSFRVIIEVDNEKENGNWVLKPGMYVQGRIQLNNSVIPSLPAASSGALTPPPTRDFSGQ